MKRLICLISTHGKTTKQIVNETWGAFQKYQKVSKESQTGGEGGIPEIQEAQSPKQPMK